MTVPVHAVLAIYARETGQGMALPEAIHAAGDEGDVEVELADEHPAPLSAVPTEPAPDGDDEGPHTPTPRRGGHLRIVK